MYVCVCVRMYEFMRCLACKVVVIEIVVCYGF